MDKKEIVRHFLNKGILISPSVLDSYTETEKFIIENNLDDFDIKLLNQLHSNSNKINLNEDKNNNVDINKTNNTDINKSDNININQQISNLSSNLGNNLINNLSNNEISNLSNNINDDNKDYDNKLNDSIKKNNLENKNQNNCNLFIEPTENKDFVSCNESNIPTEILDDDNDEDDEVINSVNQTNNNQSNEINYLKANVKVINSFDDESKKRSCQDFINYFKIRFKQIRPLLQNRQELDNNISIQRLQNKKEKETVSIIAMISEIQATKNGNIMITVEDLTGKIRCIISKDNNEIYNNGKELVLDEIVGINGFFNGEIIYVNSIVWPDVPLSKELKKCPEEVYAAFISDTEFGSKFFLKEKFEDFIKWIKGEMGSDEQKNISKKIRYLFIVGDLVDGVGVYPGQEEDLDITDIYKQYEEFANYLKQIPEYIKIITCPGNHDAMRIAEPQPALYKDLAAPVWQVSNVINVSNPAIVNIHSSETFPGFDILMYHGFSFIYYSDKVESIRQAGGQERTDLIMKFLLKRRHLAPTHQSTLYLPITTNDPLFIEKIPDFFVSGHIHQVCAANYRNVTLLNCSAWLSQTPFQEKMGINPKPGRALIANLQTREIKIMRF